LGCVQVSSLGFRTDLALRQLGGGEIVDRGDYTVVRTPANPDYWWGNFVLLPGPVRAGDGGRLAEIFSAEFPDARHRTFGIDGTAGTVGDRATVTQLGLGIEINAVMAAHGLHEPGPPAAGGAIVRRLSGDEDWEQAIALRLAVYELAGQPGQREFTARQFAEARQCCERGNGAWFGAFVDGDVVASLGLLRAWSGTARYQNVETHADHRRRGLASTLLYESSVWARDALGADTVVIVADPAYHAIDVYRSLGFEEVERQVQLERAP
jgi:ribosomal protein S18 acetylase RimI-like enzyme